MDKSIKEVLQKNRPLFEDLVKRKFIYAQTAEIYGGMAGLFDYGPIGSGIKNNLIDMWKKHFIVEEDLLEISCTTLTPAIVLRNSGHEKRFIDWMVKDEKTQETFRADHLIEDYLENLIEDEKTSDEDKKKYHKIMRSIPDFKKAEDFDKLISDFKITNPNQKKNQLGKTYAFNLMFSCDMGPLQDQRCYLRPETAQSIFTNFQKLLNFNNGQLPFGGAMVGNAYRNEIAPRNGLIRVREFEMAEIEFFIDPENKNHPKFSDVQDLVVPVYCRETQAKQPEAIKMSLKDACDKGIIANTMIGYFMGRIYLFMKSIGVREECIRFRQHLSGEMAHYACDCWDTELLSSYGWIECVGLADRSAYDLTAHTTGSGVKLVASRLLEKPEKRDQWVYKLDRAKIGKHFKKEAKQVLQGLEDLTQKDLECFKNELEKDGKSNIGQFSMTSDMFKSWEKVTKTVQEEKFIPSVIEPSFGIGRIIYCLMEQSFKVRDEKRTYFYFPPRLTPYKVVFLPLLRKPDLVQLATKLEKQFRKNGIMCRSDCGSSAIGKRYSRTDEMGIPFAVTIDFDTLKDQTVTLREIISMKQIRVPIDDLKNIIQAFTNIQQKFEDLCDKYPVVDSESNKQ